MDVNGLHTKKEKKGSILIVDDSTQNIIVLTHILEKDYTVFVSKDGHDAIEIAKKSLPDIVLLDIVMPGMDGYEVIVALKSHEKTKRIPVIFLTGLAGTVDEEKGLALGAADYIAKPFSAGIVKLRVRNQIRMLDQLRTIERLSMIDQLTEMPNRRSFDNRIHSEWGRAARDKTPISILAVDVDRFKIYNDTYGHSQGDVALKAVAKMFFEQLKRPGDFAARWGGEEFFVLLPNTDPKGAMDIAEHIRKSAEEMIIPGEGGEPTKLTVSIGVSTQLPSSKDSLSKFVASADKALYAAKGAGRNQVCYAKHEA